MDKNINFNNCQTRNSVHLTSRNLWKITFRHYFNIYGNGRARQDYAYFLANLTLRPTDLLSSPLVDSGLFNGGTFFLLGIFSEPDPGKIALLLRQQFALPTRKTLL